jgi:hypothetical protein
MMLPVPWMVWKNRIDCVLEHGRPSVRDLSIKIKDEDVSWAMEGAKGLRYIIMTTTCNKYYLFNEMTFVFPRKKVLLSTVPSTKAKSQ